MYRIYVSLNAETKKPSHASLLGIEQPDAQIVYWGTKRYEANEEVIVLKVPGHKYWSQNPPGPTHSYAPAEFQVYKVIKREDAGLLVTLETEQLAEFSVRA